MICAAVLMQWSSEHNDYKDPPFFSSVSWARSSLAAHCYTKSPHNKPHTHFIEFAHIHTAAVMMAAAFHLEQIGKQAHSNE